MIHMHDTELGVHDVHDKKFPPLLIMELYIQDHMLVYIPRTAELGGGRGVFAPPPPPNSQPGTWR